MKNGFTLIELLVVITIIGILIGIGTVAYTNASRQSRDTRRIEDLKALQSALEQCNSLTDVYPTLADSDNNTRIDSYALLCTDGTLVINDMPLDPKDSLGYKVVGSTATTYNICTDLEANGWGGYGSTDECYQQLQ